MKDYAGKFVFTQFVVGAFVVMGLEHVIANFSLFTLSFFSLEEGALDALTVGNVLTNWGMALIGNFIGGGILTSALYAWLNQGESRGGELYRD